jgi:predicted transposase YdaD
MAKTDHPLKRLITFTITEFASWFLGAEVRSVVPVPIEQTMTPDPIRSDLVFLVTLADGRTVLLHIEFQGRTSYRPVHLRLLDYMSRLAINERPDMLVSLVLYVGHGAGRHDNGQYQVAGLDGHPALHWHYQVLRLWEMDAKELLELDRPELLPLVGQTHMEQPAQVLPQVVARLRDVPEREARGRLLTELLALITDTEVLTMTEQLIEMEEDVLIDSPYLRRIREQGVMQGLEQGREEGFERGMAQGHKVALRENILDALSERFNPPVKMYRAIEQAVGSLNDEKTLRSLFTTVLRVETVEEFRQVVEQATGGEA